MKSLIEIIAYAYKFNSHLVGVRILQGGEPESGIIYKDNITNSQWRVYGVALLPKESHEAGQRSITLIPTTLDSVLEIGMTLEEV